MMAESPYAMISVAEALATVLAQAELLPAQRVALADAAGLILAESVYANEPLPPFPASTKDGYAVIAADGPGEYPLIGEATAGRIAPFTVTPGTVAYITTGAPLPAGADAVVMVEETELLTGQDGQQRVRIRQTVRAGADLRRVGSDVAAGEEVLSVGSLLGPAEIGLLATVGAAQVAVYPRPKVAVLSTGDELVDADQSPGPGQIRDSNRATLCAAIHAVGGIPVDLGIGRDEQAHLSERIQTGIERADILITTGGVSMGDLDLVKPILERRGHVHFGRIRMKPGKPVTFATVERERDGRHVLIFGLPGNPVSSLVTFYLLTVPTIRQLSGWAEPHLRQVQAVLAQPLPLDDYRPEYHRATLHWDSSLHGGAGGYLATSTGSQASSRLLSMRTANALLVLPQAAGSLPAGSVVTALWIGENL